MSAYWDYIASGGRGEELAEWDPVVTDYDWDSGSDSYGDWGNPNEWVLPDEDYLDIIKDAASKLGSGAMDFLAKAFTKKDSGDIDWRAVASAAGGIAGLLNVGGASNRPTGYQGRIPEYAAVRQAVQPQYDPNRRPGSGGQRYFTDTQYVPKTGEGAAEALTAAQNAAAEQATGIASLNAQNPARQLRPASVLPPPTTTGTTEPTASRPASSVIEDKPVPYTAKQGGIVNLQPGGFVLPADVISHMGNGSSDAGMRFAANKLGARPIRGRGDGMSDSNATSIAGQQPAAVAHEEAYLDPQRVQDLGGAERLYKMMDRIREARTGTTKQGRQINPAQFMPRQA